MSGIGAFLQGFANTTMEYQKRAQEERQFEMQLQAQKAIQEMQVNQFNQTMQMRELERQDALKEAAARNQIANYTALTGRMSEQNLEKERVANREEKAREHDQATKAKYDLARNDPKLLEIEKDAQFLEGMGFTAEAASVREAKNARYKELDLTPEDVAAANAKPGQAAAPAVAPAAASPQAQAAGAPPAAQPAAPGTAPMNVPAQQAAAPPQQGATPYNRQVQTLEQRFPSAQPSPGEGPGFGLKKIQTESPQASEFLNARLKALKAPGYGISKQEEDENKRKESEARLKTAIAQGELAGMPEQKGTIEDMLAQANLPMDINVVPKGTKYKSMRMGGHIGALVLGSGISGGGTSGSSSQQLPYVDFYPKLTSSGLLSKIGLGSEEDTSVDGTLKLATVLAQGASEGKTVSQPYVVGAQDVIRDRRDDALGKYGKDKVIYIEPFDSFNEPERHKAASNAIALGHADQLLGTVSAKNGVPYEGTGIPQVVDQATTPAETLDRFAQATKKITAFKSAFPNLEQRPAEGHMLSELMTRMQPDQPDGTYSPAAVTKAKTILEKTMGAQGVSDRFKKGVQDILTPIATQEPKEGKPTGALEEGARRQAGAGGANVQGMAIRGALQGLVGAQADVSKSTQAFQSVTQKDISKASSAVTDVKNAYGRMTDTEKTQAQNTWKARRDNWKKWNVKDDVIKSMNLAVGLDKNDGF